MHDPPVVQVGHGLGDLLEDGQGPIQRVLGGEADHVVQSGGMFDTGDYGQVGVPGAGPAEENHVVVTDVAQHVELLLEMIAHEWEGAAVGFEQNLSVPVAGGERAELAAADLPDVADLLEVNLPVGGLGGAGGLEGGGGPVGLSRVGGVGGGVRQVVHKHLVLNLVLQA